jgi:hypothetical protein
MPRQRNPNNRPRPKEQQSQSPWDNEGDDISQSAKDFADEDKDGQPPRDITTTNVMSPLQFRSERFAELNIKLVSDYADYRVIGWNAERAFTRVFGTDYADLHLYARIEALEHNMVYRKVFAQKFGVVKLEEMYGPKLAVYELVSLMNNPFTKCSTKLSAMKELNVLFGITVIDDSGRTRAGRSLKEFYEDTNQPTPNAKPNLTGRHPEPGSKESEEFLTAQK